MAQGDSVFALGIVAIIKFVLPSWLFCLAVFINLSFVVIKKLFNKVGRVVMGCALATSPLGSSFNV